LLDAKPYEEMYEFCDFSLTDQVRKEQFTQAICRRKKRARLQQWMYLGDVT
jgi:hypothetical protein